MDNNGAKAPSKDWDREKLNPPRQKYYSACLATFLAGTIRPNRGAKSSKIGRRLARSLAFAPVDRFGIGIKISYLRGV